MWYLFKIKFDGPKNKTIREQHLLNVDDPGAGTTLLKSIIKPRVKKFTITSVALAEFAHIAEYAGTAGQETAISYPFHVVTLDLWDHKDKYLIPANGHDQAIERALYDSNMDDDRIYNYKEMGITGVWDNLSEFWMGDWRNRMDVREACHFHTPKEDPEDAKKKQTNLWPDNVDPETGEELRPWAGVDSQPPVVPPFGEVLPSLEETEAERIVRELAELARRNHNTPALSETAIRTGEVVSVEGEDLGNEVNPEHEEYLTALPTSTLLPEGTPQEPTVTVSGADDLPFEFSPREWAVGDRCQTPGGVDFLVLHVYDDQRFAEIITIDGDSLRVDLSAIHGEKFNTGLAYEYQNDNRVAFDWGFGVFEKAFTMPYPSEASKKLATEKPVRKRKKAVDIAWQKP